jgi:PAS domain S-box-containing protein
VEEKYTVIRFSAEIYRIIAEGTLQGLMIIQNNRHVFVNQSLADIVGYTVEDLLQMSSEECWALVHPDDQPLLASRDKAREEGRKLDFKYEYRYICKDGSIKWVEAYSRSIRYDEKPALLILAVDVTDRKKAQEELQKREMMLRAVFETAKDIIFIKDKNMKYIRVNPAMADLFDKSIEELLGSTDIELFGEEDGKTIQESDRKVLQGETFENVAARPVRRKPYVFHSIKVPLRNSEGEIVGIVGIARDVTEILSAQEALKKQRDELSEFAHMMRHDIKNGLQAILGYVDYYSEVSNNHNFKKILELVESLDDLLDKSVALADAGKIIGDVESVDLEEIVSQIAFSVVPEGIDFEHTDLPKIYCDKDKMKQVIQNLLLNAVEHGKPSSIKVRLEKDPTNLSLLFINDGIPIPKTKRENIFSSHLKSKTATGGLGLAIVKRIVEAHGWTITLDSSKTTTFRITIPNEALVFK